MSEAVWPAIKLFFACIPPKSITLRCGRHYKGRRSIFYYFQESKYLSSKTRGRQCQRDMGEELWLTIPWLVYLPEGILQGCSSGTPFALHWHVENRRQSSVLKRKELFCTKIPSLPMFPKRGQFIEFSPRKKCQSRHKPWSSLTLHSFRALMSCGLTVNGEKIHSNVLCHPQWQTQTL